MSRLLFVLPLTALLIGCAAGGDAMSPPFAESAPNKPGTPDDDSGDTDPESDATSDAATSEPVPGTTSTSTTDPAPATTTDAPPACGDGQLDPGEQCDDGNLDPTDTCTNTCQPATCGDGIVQVGEQCDDGNLVPGDGCEPGCTLPGCGDGVVQPGEQCDDGNPVDTDACTSLCKKPICGDGVLHPGEQCDDGNGIATDACVNCEPAVCGDGNTFQGAEECDDANAVATDACVNCKAAKCGDGVVWAGAETCDGGVVFHGNCVACKLTCSPGWGDCDNAPQTGCETDVATNTAHCGACGKVCGQGEQCKAGKCVGDYGPQHTFVGITSEHFVTQNCCSVGCQGNDAVDAAYFCAHFYGPGCVVKPGYAKVFAPSNVAKMHKGISCDPNGIDIPNTQCDNNAPCKMYTLPNPAISLTGLVCQCP